MSDKYRILGKVDENTDETVYLLELQINRTLMVSRADMNTIFTYLGVENISDGENRNDGGWDEMIKFLKSCFEGEGFPKEDVKLINTDFKEISFSTENLFGILNALNSQLDQFTTYTEGTPDSGGVLLIMNIAAKTYKKLFTSSSQAKIFAANMTEFKDEITIAGLSPRAIDKIRELADWGLRISGIYDIAERAWQSARDKIESGRVQRDFDRDWKNHFERERIPGIERAREMDFAERVSRTA